ncbi:MAG: hypothetical protein AB7S81_04005, partial [Bdellovibrionales bacterium]
NVDPSVEIAIADDALIATALVTMATTGGVLWDVMQRSKIDYQSTSYQFSKFSDYLTKTDKTNLCDPPEGTTCTGDVHDWHPHWPYNDHYHLYQMQRVRRDNTCKWKIIPDKSGGVTDVPPTGIPNCQSFSNFKP